jgi:GNAT superfamily N-acetyltransferase
MQTAEELHRVLRLRKATPGDYALLRRFHYAPGSPGLILRSFAFDDTAGGARYPIAVIIYSRPTLNCRGRNLACSGYFAKIVDPKARALSINRNIARLSRLIVHPAYRGLGLASRMLAESLPLAGRPLIEAASVMSGFGTLFEKNGFHRVAAKPDRETENLLGALREAGLGLEPLWNPGGFLEDLPRLPERKRTQIIRASRRFMSRYRSKRLDCSTHAAAEAVERVRTGGSYYWIQTGRLR